MSFSKTIYSLVGVLVAVIMIATVAMPAITSASTTTTTTTTTEVQDVEVSDPIYYKPYSSMVKLSAPDENTVFIQQYVDGLEWTGYTIYGNFTNIPIIVSDTLVCNLYRDGGSCFLTVCGFDSSGNLAGNDIRIGTSSVYSFEIDSDGIDVSSQHSGTHYKTPTWNYFISIPEYGGDYVASTSQEVVTLGSLNEIVAGASRWKSPNTISFAYIYDGEQTQYGDYALGISSVQTDAGVEVSLKASYDDTEVLVLVPTTIEVEVTQTITVQTEYGPILNVVLLMLLIVPVTAVAAMLYSRRD